ncbi:esterase-like activity of phytase family protein [Roseobacter sinensis]|uniref:Esterase-like activity of phytase family protein n=1 Tax=Roseobacter sinensis TaxID=2931391 RepID=A0ABT3B964_9RHOB|nr:esterase-like activity of phytase family protein [Roseobacter sp. WL0113]MCV3270106.1 esterase-like activity of phytase family protein [Roseobacter sp. WL0113]
MRYRLAVAGLGLLATALLFYLFPMPAPLAMPPADQPAQHVSTYRWQHDAAWFGGFSGFEVTPDGEGFFAVTDRAHLVRGRLHRTGGKITGATLEAQQRLVDKNGKVERYPHDDAEGLALDADGRLFVSFEGAQRILRYDTWESHATWPSYTRAWRALGSNIGLEAVAVDAAGTLFTVPEGVLRGAYEALVYRRHPQGKWQQPFTLPLDGAYRPVGADFGPDGRLYLLEREFHWLGFRNRVRAMTVTDTALRDIETLLETPQRRHGNLEGLSVWADDSGQIHLTMVSDDNFLPVLRTEIIEYVLTD